MVARDAGFAKAGHWLRPALAAALLGARVTAVAGVGLRYFGEGSTSGPLQLNTVLGRDHIDEYSISATIRSDF